MKTHNASPSDKEEGYFLVPKSWLNTIAENNSRILSILENGNNTPLPNSLGDYISEKEAMKLLGKKTTWFWNMRKKGLESSKVGGTNYYNKNDILKLLESNKKIDSS